VEVFDWNQIENDKRIAKGKIQLDDLPLFERAVQKIQLRNELEPPKPGGVLNLHMVFRPALLMRKKQNSGVVVSATKALTGISSGVGNVVSSSSSFVGSGVNLVGSGASTFVSGVGSGFGILRKPKSDKPEETAEETVATRSINLEEENSTC